MYDAPAQPSVLRKSAVRAIRPHRSGSVFQRNTGEWVALISLPNGKRRSKWGKSKAEALRNLRDLQAAAALGPYIPPPPRPLPPAMVGARRANLPTKIRKEWVAEAKAAGWSVKSLPEARIAIYLSRFGLTPRNVAEQYKIDRWRLDFAAPDVQIGIEVDGPHHRLPEAAVKDLERDAILGAAGWIIFRVDAYGADAEIEHRISRIARFVRGERLAA